MLDGDDDDGGTITTHIHTTLLCVNNKNNLARCVC